VWAHLDDVDLTPGAPVRRLDLVADHGLEGGLVGDVTDRFEPSEPMSFLPAVDAG
jgi:choloylglycine hydrolase